LVGPFFGNGEQYGQVICVVVCASLFLRRNMQIKNNLAKRQFYNIMLDCDLIKQIKILASQLDKRQNDLTEEAIQDVLKKYTDLDRPEPSFTKLFLIKTLPKDT
jgi:hypothetical protein